MKRLLTYLFLVIGLGLIFSESTFAKEKVYFCSKPGDYWKGASRISTIPCSKVMVSASKGKWEKISAKKYINTYGQVDTAIQSLYDEFEKHDLDTNIIRKITKKEKKKKKTLEDKEKERSYGIFTIVDKKQEGIEAVIALWSNKKNLNTTAESIKIKVKGMTCSHCESNVVKGLMSLEGSISAEANHKTGEVIFNSSEYNPIKVKEVIESFNYEVV